MRKACSIALLMSIAAAGCVTTSQTSTLLKIAAPFDRDQAAEAIKDGPNSVSGSAFMRQRGGGVVTCAGSDVLLIPVTAYSTARMAYIYPSTSGGHAQVPATRLGFDPDPPEYSQLRRVVKCDARGDFTFEAVADGDFYVVTNVLWEVAGVINGGALMQRISVRGKSLRALTLAQ